jgi:hypothetical protein
MKALFTKRGLLATGVLALAMSSQPSKGLEQELDIYPLLLEHNDNAPPGISHGVLQYNADLVFTVEGMNRDGKTTYMSMLFADPSFTRQEYFLDERDRIPIHAGQVLDNDAMLERTRKACRQTGITSDNCAHMALTSIMFGPEHASGAMIAVK